MIAPRNQIILVRTLTAIVCGSAGILAVGISNQFTLFNTVVSASCFLLAITAFVQGYRSWALGFLVAGIVFNPIFRIAYFPRFLWVLLDLSLFSYTSVFAFVTTNPYRKGMSFEQYVFELFPEDRFDAVDRTRDISKYSGRKVESDSYPDLLFRNKKTGDLLAIECKFASKWHYKGDVDGIYLREYQLENYRSYSAERNIPVYIAFGIGGIPEKPKEVYFVPLEWIKYDFVYRSLIMKGKKAEEF